MKKLIWFLASLMIVAGLLFVAGCDDDDDDNGLIPGNENDPSLDAFLHGYEDYDDITGEMVEGTIYFFYGIIDLIESTSKLSASADPTIEYNAGSQFWYCTETIVEDVTIEMVDSIQFFHGDTPVQYPNTDSLTKIVSYMRITATGEYITTGTAYQNLQITTKDVEGDTIAINGTGGINTEYIVMDINETDTTTCDVSYNFATSFNNLLWYADEIFPDNPDYIGEFDCPMSGSITSSGPFSASCTGAETTSVGGNWTVTDVFTNPNIKTTISNGTYVWDHTEQCRDD